MNIVGWEMEDFLKEQYRTRGKKYNIWNEKYTGWDLH